MASGANADLVATYNAIILGNRAVFAVAALVAYEHIVTLKYEIDFLWRLKWSAATWIFVSNRYFLLAYVSFSGVPVSPQICGDARMMKLLSFLIVGTVPVLPIHVFTILRSFALLPNRFWRLPVTGILIVLVFAVSLLNAFLDFTQTWSYVVSLLLGSSCYSVGHSLAPNTLSRMTIAGAVIGITLTVIVLVITLIKTARQRRQVSSFARNATMSDVVLRDGSMFLLLILLDDIVAAIIATNGAAFPETATVLMGPALRVLPHILLSRFIINLRRVVSPTPGPITFTDQGSIRLSTVASFRMPTVDDIVGNIGEPLEFTEFYVEDDSEVSEHVYGNADVHLKYRGEDTSRTRIENSKAVGSSGGGSAGGAILEEVCHSNAVRPLD